MKWLPIKAYKWKKEFSDGIFEILRKQKKETEKTFDPSAPICDFMCGFSKARNEAVAENEQEKLALMADDYVLATLEDMFLGGYETTSNTLLWNIAYLANFPEYQAKIQQELDDVVSRDTFPCVADRPNLPLLQAFTMEVSTGYHLLYALRVNSFSVFLVLVLTRRGKAVEMEVVRGLGLTRRRRELISGSGLINFPNI